MPCAGVKGAVCGRKKCGAGRLDPSEVGQAGKARDDEFENVTSAARCAWIPRRFVKAGKARDDEFENVTSAARNRFEWAKMWL